MSDFAGTLEQDLKDLDRLPAQPYLRAVPAQLAGSHVQLERAEARDRGRRSVRATGSHGPLGVLPPAGVCKTGPLQARLRHRAALVRVRIRAAGRRGAVVAPAFAGRTLVFGLVENVVQF